MSSTFRMLFKISLVGVIFCNSCTKDPPVVTTSSVTQITQTTAVSGGNVTNNGGADVTACGIYWGTAQNAATTGNKTSDGKGNGPFTSNLSGLSANTTYYVRAYATNSEGTGYGLETSFNTTGYPPVAEFMASPATITAGQSVQFTDQSTNTPSSWSWNFGDGGTSTAQNPSHTFTSPNTYSVSLNVSNSFGSDVESKSNYITVSPAGAAPVAAFTASATIITAGLSVQFTDQSTNSPTSWSWNFGDGGTSTTQNPSHIFSSPNTYSISLTVANSFGSDIESKGSYITVLTAGLTDKDGNTYKTVTIGPQEWMAENLKTTKYNDGTPISNISNGTQWSTLTSAAYCWYDNDAGTNKEKYGALYNWYAVNTGILCPVGWRVSTDEDWINLEMYLGMTRQVAEQMYWRGSDEGSKLKSSSGWDQNGNGTNVSGFTALPGGYRDYDGTFLFKGNWTDFWSSTGINTTTAWSRALGFSHNDIGRYNDSKVFGFSVRCIKQ